MRLLVHTALWLCVASAALATSGNLNGRVNTPTARASANGVPCTGITDGRSALQTLITNTAGGTVIIDSGCSVLLSSASTALTVQSGTTLVFEDDSSRLLMARRACVTGSYIGAGCAVDADCRSGGTCGCDTGSGSSCAFAPTGGSTYTVIKAASSSKDIRIENPRIEVRQQDSWGRCLATTSGAQDGLPCASNSDCTGGYCGPDSGTPSGPGKINVIDLSTATRSQVIHPIISDHRIGDFDVKVGQSGLIRDPDNTVYSIAQFGRCAGSASEGATCTTDFECGGLFGTGKCEQPPRTVTDGFVLAGSYAKLRDGTVGGYATGVRVQGTPAKVGGVDFPPNGAWGPTATAIYLESASQATFTGNFANLWYSCFAGDPNGYNVDVNADRCYFSTGPKLIAQNAGWQVNGGYWAWGTTTCTGGSRVGLGCKVADTSRGYGCPGASTPWCTVAQQPAVQVGPGSLTTGALGVSHLEIYGARIHNNLDSGPLISFPNSPKRCDSGPRIYLACTTDDTNATTGCGSGALGDDGSACGVGHTGCCNAIGIDSVVIGAGTHLYTSAANSIGIDLSALGSSATTTLTGSTFSANIFDLGASSAAGIKLPTTTGSVTKLALLNNSFAGMSGGTPILNWNWAFGNRSGNIPLNYVDAAEPVVAYFQNTSGGSNITAGQGVALRSGTNNIQYAAIGATSIVGVALEACNTTRTDCKVATYGPASCAVATAAAFTAGDLLKPDPSTTAGNFVAATASDSPVATVMVDKSGGSGTSVPCFVGARGPAGTSGGKASYGGSVSVSASQTKFIGWGAGSSTETDVQIPMPIAGTIGSLTCESDTAPGSNVVFTVRKNATDQALTCTRGTGGTSCSDTNGAHAFSVVVGDLLSIKTVTIASSGSHLLKCSVSLS